MGKRNKTARLVRYCLHQSDVNLIYVKITTPFFIQLFLSFFISFHLLGWSTSCGGEVNGTGIIYPPEGKYPYNKDCQWTITRSGYFTLKFQSFYLEDHSSCAYDYIQIDEGTKLCGSNLPADVYIPLASICPWSFDRIAEQVGKDSKW